MESPNWSSKPEEPIKKNPEVVAEVEKWVKEWLEFWSQLDPFNPKRDE
jgi:hypothetical protein